MSINPLYVLPETSPNPPGIPGMIPINVAPDGALSYVLPAAFAFSTLEVVKEILGPAQTLTLNSTEKMGYGCGGHDRELVEVRVNDDGLPILQFAAKIVGYRGYGRSRSPIYEYTMVDPQNRVLMTARPDNTFLAFILIVRDFAFEQVIGKFTPLSGCTNLRYDVNRFPPENIVPKTPYSYIKAVGLTKNWCCYSTETINFFGGKDQVIGEMKRLPPDPVTSNAGHSQLMFKSTDDENIDVVIKLWMLYVAYKIHYWNFTRTCLSKNGARGYRWRLFSILCSVIILFVLASMIVITTILLSISKHDCFWNDCGLSCSEGFVQENSRYCTKQNGRWSQLYCCPDKIQANDTVRRELIQLTR